MRHWVPKVNKIDTTILILKIFLSQSRRQIKLGPH